MVVTDIKLTRCDGLKGFIVISHCESLGARCRGAAQKARLSSGGGWRTTSRRGVWAMWSSVWYFSKRMCRACGSHVPAVGVGGRSELQIGRPECRASGPCQPW